MTQEPATSTATAETSPDPFLVWTAWLTPWLAMLPIIMGALTTTKNAGMAFPDWPTSDQQGMFTYPWLQLVDGMFADPEKLNKFLEHGHRLAGTLLAPMILALIIATWTCSKSPRLRTLAILMAIGVGIQGLLGGYRVELNEIFGKGLALIHGFFASLVFALMCVVGVMAGKKWHNRKEHLGEKPVGALSKWAIGFIVLICMQYLLGGFLRHRGTALHEHLTFGIISGIAVSILAVRIRKLKNPWLKSSSVKMVAITHFQVVLGLITFLTKFGLPSMGYVAVAGSTDQIFFRTLHMVTGVLVVSAATVTAVKLWMVKSLQLKASSVPSET